MTDSAWPRWIGDRYQDLDIPLADVVAPVGEGEGCHVMLIGDWCDYALRQPILAIAQTGNVETTRKAVEDAYDHVWDADWTDGPQIEPMEIDDLTPEQLKEKLRVSVLLAAKHGGQDVADKICKSLWLVSWREWPYEIRRVMEWL